MLLLAAALLAAPPRIAPQPASSNCPRTTNHYADRSGEAVKPRRLTELPPANAYVAVYRLIGHCEAPIVVKYGVGHR